MPHDASKWDAWLTSTGRQQIEHFLRDGYLARQRWFGSKTRTISAVRLTDHFWLNTTRGPVLVACAEVYFTPAESESYWTYLNVEPRPGDAILSEAVDDPELSRAFLRLLNSRGGLATAHGEVRAQSLQPLTPEAESLPVVRSQTEQSNTSLRIGDQYVLKLFRRAVPGLNPDYEIGRFLLEQTSFRHVPPLIGAIVYQRSDQEPMVLAMVQGWVVVEEDGWVYALGQVQRSLEAPIALAGATGWLGDAACLGRRTGELHLALASNREDAAFRPEAMSQDDFAALRVRMQANLDMGLRLLEKRPLPPMVQRVAAQVLSKRVVLEQRLEAALPQPYPQKIRCHGDYHLGQVLRTQDDFVILDFEGEPSRPLAERRAKQSPLKDVAGMLRSFSYAATAGLLAQGREAGLETIAHDWESDTAVAFLTGYHQTVRAAPFLPSDDRRFNELLDLFILDKILYELLYELNNRPTWVDIPLRGIEALSQEV